MNNVKKFVSLDWDFFINVPHDTEQVLFPQERDLIAKGEKCDDHRVIDYWSKCVQDIEHDGFEPSVEMFDLLLRSSGVQLRQADYNKIMYSFLSQFRGSKVAVQSMVSRNHSDLFPFVFLHTNGMQEPFTVYNLDKHSDCFIGAKDSLNSSNWARLMVRNCGKSMAEIIWMHPDTYFDTSWLDGDCLTDSFDRSNGNKVRAFFDDIMNSPNTYLFLCRSDFWTPPTFDGDFEKMVKYVKAATGSNRVRDLMFGEYRRPWL